MMQIFTCLFFLLALSACSTKTKIPETVSDSEALEKPISMDYVGLQRELGLEFAVTNLGYREKAFNTCEAGYGFSPNKNCRKAYFTVLYFQLLCRDSQDTVSAIISESQMFPLSGRKVRWTFRDQQGVLELDFQGFGQILAVAPTPSSNQRLKLGVDNDFLYTRAGEVKQLVTPSNWCNQ